MLRWPLTAKQVDAHGISGDGGTRINRSEGNAHRSVPSVRAFIDAGFYFETGVPCPPVFVVRLAQIDIQIDPFSLRRDFKLLIALDIRKIGADEGFGNVPIPQLIRFFLSIRRRLQVEFLVRADEQKIKIALRPARPDLGTIARNTLSETVFL